MTRHGISVAALCASLAFGIMASAPAALAGNGEDIGDAVKIINTVTAALDSAKRDLSTGDDVRQNEVIAVGADSRGELKLNDDTKLALGPGARLVLDKFVYDSDKKAGSVVVNLAKGAFRFITGVAQKPTYVINTPSASITVRGTVFDVYVLPDNSVWLLLLEGAVEVTGRKNLCRVLDQPGRLLHIAPKGTVGKPVNWNDLPGKDSVDFEKAFPFIEAQMDIGPAPALTRATVQEAAFEDTEDKTCLNPHPRTPVKVQRASIDAATPPPVAPPPTVRIKKPKVVVKQPEPEPDPPKVRVKRPKVVVKQPEPEPDPPKVRVKKPKVVVRQPKDDDDPPKRVRVTKRPRNDDDGWGNGVRGMDIVIGGGGGFGGFGRPKGGRGMRGN